MALWPWETQGNAEQQPQPNRAQRRAMDKNAKRMQRRGQRAYNRQVKAADRAEKE